MKNARVKQILEAAAKLPPVKARALVAAIAGKTQDGKTQDAREEDGLSDAALLMEAAMLEAVLKTLEQSPP